MVGSTLIKIQDLIAQNMNNNWGTLTKLEKFSKELCEKIASFEETVRDLVSKIDSIHSIFNQISKSELSKETIHEKVSLIQKHYWVRLNLIYIYYYYHFNILR